MKDVLFREEHLQFFSNKLSSALILNINRGYLRRTSEIMGKVTYTAFCECYGQSLNDDHADDRKRKYNFKTHSQIHTSNAIKIPGAIKISDFSKKRCRNSSSNNSSDTQPTEPEITPTAESLSEQLNEASIANKSQAEQKLLKQQIHQMSKLLEERENEPKIIKDLEKKNKDLNKTIQQFSRNALEIEEFDTPERASLTLRKLRDLLAPKNMCWLVDACDHNYLKTVKSQKKIPTSLNEFIMATYLSTSYNRAATLRMSKMIGLSRSSTLRTLHKNQEAVPILGIDSVETTTKELEDRLNYIKNVALSVDNIAKGLQNILNPAFQ